MLYNSLAGSDDTGDYSGTPATANPPGSDHHDNPLHDLQKLKKLQKV